MSSFRTTEFRLASSPGDWR